MDRKIIQRNSWWQLVIISSMVAVMACFLAYSLKWITEHGEEIIFGFIEKTSDFLFIVDPTVGITLIYFLRKYLFKNRKNKGITEIYKTTEQRKDHLPLFKIPSHYINGFLTVIFGGSTGIEVSTVVATATIGNAAYKNEKSPNSYKLELICAGVVAGVAVLFGAPLAGWFFALEVIAKKISKTLFISCTASALTSWLFLNFFEAEPLISAKVTEWKTGAIPFFIILSLLSGLLSVYFTKTVIYIKQWFSMISNNFLRVNMGALAVGTMIFFFPFLYGDSYHSLSEILHHPMNFSLVFLLLIVVLKPLASALTLGAGGDGGVFAPSIVVGFFLGIGFAYFCNTFFGTSLIYLNFALIGAAATLSGSIFAPFTALFLVCNLAPNGYGLFFPILVCCLLSHRFAKMILPYNVYTYNG